jgi:hypothetical protein
MVRTVIQLLKFFQFNSNQVEARTIFQLLNVYKQQPLTRWWLGRYWAIPIIIRTPLLRNLGFSRGGGVLTLEFPGEGVYNLTLEFPGEGVYY